MFKFRSACTAGPGSRILRGAVAMFIGAFAAASLDTPIVAVFAALAALFVLFMAITGWCPGTLDPSAGDPLAVDLTKSGPDQ